jgi:hypothetical protein
MQGSGEAIPLVCRPDAIPLLQRAGHFALACKLFQRLGEMVEERDDGYTFRFTADAFEPLARFVANERRCCPAIRFEIQVGAGGGAIELRMSGPAGAREFLAAELPLRRGGRSCAQGACS